MSVAAKLQVKPGQRVAVLGAAGARHVDLPDVERIADASAAEAVIVYAADLEGLEAFRGAVVDSARRDALTWVAYPKGGQLGTDLNRDVLAAALTTDGVRPVRQVAIDEVWSALRFRPA
jgi:hypothetical protein